MATAATTAAPASERMEQLIRERAQERSRYDRFFRAPAAWIKTQLDKLRDVARNLKLDRVASMAGTVLRRVHGEISAFGYGKAWACLAVSRSGREAIGTVVRAMRSAVRFACRLVHKPLGWVLEHLGDGGRKANAWLVRKGRALDTWFIGRVYATGAWFERHHEDGWMRLLRTWLDFRLVGHVANRWVPAKWRWAFYLGAAAFSPLGAERGGLLTMLKATWNDLKDVWNDGKATWQRRRSGTSQQPPAPHKVVDIDPVETKVFARDRKSGRVGEFIKRTHKNGKIEVFYADTFTRAPGKAADYEEITETSYRDLKTKQDAADAAGKADAPHANRAERRRPEPAEGDGK